MRLFLFLLLFLSLQAKDVYEQIRVRWVDYLSGNQSIKTLSAQEQKSFIATLNKRSSEILSTLQTSQEKTSLFAQYPDMKNGENIMFSYANLSILAQAYVTPNSRLYKNKEVKEKILHSLEWLYQNAYKEGVPEYGNWWHWEIGIPKILNEILAMMHPQIPQEKLKQYLGASIYFQPKANYSGYSPMARYSSSPSLRISTGGNRLDTAMVSFGRGILLKDEEQIFDGLNAIPEVDEYVTQDDGFYRDGSFIQHTTVPYNGTYASVLLDGLGTILYLTHDTPYEFKDDGLINIYQAVLDSYSMLFINGGINDSVSGRSISRDGSNELTRGKDLLQSISILSQYAPKTYRTKMRAMVKKILDDNTDTNPIPLVHNLKARRILQDIYTNEPSVQKAIKSKVFWGMDRVVHQGKKGAKFVLSMHSSRIANYESMNGENKQGWYSSDGMVYIYDNDSSKVKDFWATVDPYHLSGTTESINPRKDSSGQRRSFQKMIPRSFAGGVSNSKITYAGMDFLSWNGKTSAKKSWLFLGDTMIAMGSNISSTDGEIHTTISNRDSRNDPFIYQSLNPTNSISKNFVGNWLERGGSSPDPITKPYKLIYINHGKNPTDANYLYSVGLDNIKLSEIQVISQNDKAHALRVKDILGIHFWQDRIYQVEKYTSYTPLSLLAKENQDSLELWVSDPTQSSKIPSTLEIKGLYSLQDSSSDTKIETTSKKTILRIPTQKNGNSHYIKLKKMEN